MLVNLALPLKGVGAQSNVAFFNQVRDIGYSVPGFILDAIDLVVMDESNQKIG